MPVDLPPPGSASSVAAGGPPAERTVRLAWATDAAAVAAVQAAELAAARPPLPLPIGADDLEPAWLAAIMRPPTARHRVLVAVELGRVVGFVATGPAEDPDSDPAEDGEMVALHAVVDSHGGGGATVELRAALAAAAADTLAADGFARAQAWLAADDDDLRAVLHAAGWTVDGATRSLDASEPADDGGSAEQSGSAEADGPADAGGPADDGEQADAGRPQAALRQIRLHVGLG